MSISALADRLGIRPDHVLPWGRQAAKIDLDALAASNHRGRLILVSAITPTPAGEGKTTTTIGLAQGLAKRGVRAAMALRQPSLGPCLGMKGGATGGGRASIHPAESINLHFTGDFHAITAANNLLAAAIDNHLHQGNALGLDGRRVAWRRVMDMNDRALRNLVLGLGGRGDGVPREGGFDITAASEVMAALCLANDMEDLRARLDRIHVGYGFDGRPVFAAELKMTGAMLALLRDAMMPNLVQSTEGVPAFVHGGPFANIAHGCNSVVATRMALAHADVAVTEAGFAFDLGGEKFFHIKARSAGLRVAAIVLVATVRALKMHGGAPLGGPADANAVRAGLPNLARHIESARRFVPEVVVALNHFESDTTEEVAAVRRFCEENDTPFAVTDQYGRGGDGATELADAVLSAANGDPWEREVASLYSSSASPIEKMRTIVREVYGGRDVIVSREAKNQLDALQKLGAAHLPICMAKTQNSLSDDPARRGRPDGFDIHVRSVKANTGAGFLVAITGDVVRMPGLPAVPNAEAFDVINGEIVGMR